DVDALRNESLTLAEIPFESERQYSAHLREVEGRPLLCVKGAPERVLALSESMQGPEGLVPIDRDTVLGAANSLAALGLRVLAMAYTEEPARPDARTGTIPEPERLVLAGLVGMVDPPRAGVRDAIAACRDAG